MSEMLLSDLGSEIDLNILACPYCVKQGGGALRCEPGGLQCVDCGRRFHVQEGTIVFNSIEPDEND